MSQRTATFLVLGAVATAAGCTPPVGSKSARDVGGDTAAADPLVDRLWENTVVRVGMGAVHRIKPEETPLVRAAVRLKERQIRKCFEEPVRTHGCRTGGTEKAFDAMLMIEPDGSVSHLRIQPGRQDLPRGCDDAVRCVAEVFEGMRIGGLERFLGKRQAYLTVYLLTPDEEDLRVDGGDAPP